MLTTQQTTNRSLECVWTLSGKGLKCIWVERAASAPAGDCRQQNAPDSQQRVA
jgi:hypothetical protein